MKHRNIITLLLFITTVFVSADIYAVTPDQSGRSIFNILDTMTSETLRITITNLLSPGSSVLAFARSTFIGIAAIMIVIYVIHFTRGGTDLLDRNGLFFFVVVVLVVAALLFTETSVNIQGISVNTVWIGALALEAYGTSLDSGRELLESATGGSIAAGSNPVEVLFKVVFRLRFIDETSGFWGFLLVVLSEIVVILLFIIFAALVWIITSILPMIIAIMSIFLIITLPLVLFDFGKSIFFSVVSIMIGLSAAILAEWIAVAFCLNILANFAEVSLTEFTVGWLRINWIDIPIANFTDAIGIVFIIVICCALALSLPAIAGVIGGRAIGNSAKEGAQTILRFTK